MMILCLVSFVLALICLSRVKHVEAQLALLNGRLAGWRCEPEERNNPEPAALKRPAPVPLPDPFAAHRDKVSRFAKRTARSLEQQVVTRLPVWIGGIALALAGVFMVRYSVETGLLSPTIRVALGGIFGLGLLYAGRVILDKPSVDNGRRIAQSMVGAGIADLYACLYAAASLYHLIPSSLAFAGMAGVTAYAVIASLRSGAPIALLGLAGGFLTPAVIHSAAPSAPLLFLYLYFLIAGLFAVIRKQGWWIYGGIAVALAYLWVFAWAWSSLLDGETGLCLATFLIAVGATVVLASRQAIDAMNRPIAIAPVAMVNYLSLGGAALLMAWIVTEVDFDPMSWTMFGCLSAGGVVLAWSKARIYAFVPWLSCAASLVMIIAWQHPDPVTMALTIAAFASLYGIAGYRLSRGARQPVYWAALGVTSALAYYVAAYCRLHSIYDTATVGFPLWGIVALSIAAFAVWATSSLSAQSESDRKQVLLSIYAAAATAFLSLGLSVELPHDILPVALAGEIMAIGWIDSRVGGGFLVRIAGALTVGFAALLLPQCLLLLQLAVYSLIEVDVPLQSGIPIVTWPLFQLGLPALLLLGAGYFFRRTGDGRLVQCLEAAAIALLGLMGYYLIRHGFHAEGTVLFARASFAERGVVTNALFLYGLACLIAGQRLDRTTLNRGGMILCGIAIVRIVYFDLLVANPAWSHQFVGTLPVFNDLLVPYGLPIIWLAIAGHQLPRPGQTIQASCVKSLTLVLLFTLVSLTLRQLFHGGYLDTPVTGNAEIYAYSIAWLLLGLAFLVIGTARHDRTMRSASLVLILLTIGKVFLYDAGQLAGLYRIASFLGLGVSLLGLSWFYAKFVFPDRKDHE